MSVTLPPRQSEDSARGTASPQQPQRSAARQALSRFDIKGAPYLFIAPFFIIFAIFGFFPLVYTAYVSLFQWDPVGDHSFIGLDNFTTLFGDEYFWNAVKNTFGMFLLATIPQLTVALWLANLLNRRMRVRTLFRMSVLLPNVTSVAAVAIVFTMLFARDFGLVNFALQHLGIGNSAEPFDWQLQKWSSWFAISTMIDWRWTGYNALIFLAAMQTIPKDLYEAAAIDGASRARQFFSVTLPMLRPTMIFTVIVSTIGGIQLYTEPLLFNPGANSITGGDLRQFQTVAMFLVEEFQSNKYGYAAAIAWMLLLFVIIVSFVNFLILRRLRSAD